MEVIIINVVIYNFNKECIKTQLYVINKILDASQYGKYFENKRDVL